MYRSILDSGWVDVESLTVLVGKNEVGKTSLLRALHKLNPFVSDPYNMDSEWPRGRRQERNPAQKVCTARFEFVAAELAELKALTGSNALGDTIDLSRDYSGKLTYSLQKTVTQKYGGPDFDAIVKLFPTAKEPVGEVFQERVMQSKEKLIEFMKNTPDLLPNKVNDQVIALKSSTSPADTQPQVTNEQQFIGDYENRAKEMIEKLKQLKTTSQKIAEYATRKIPTFVYMSDYRAFAGSAQLDQIKERRNRNALTEEDKTILMVMKISGLDLDKEVEKGNSPNREQRQYDLDDASATLTRTISDRWKQRRYEVQFRADGQLFYTFVKDQHDPALIRLEERSQGFQWFFSFDLMFMYESKGTFKGCVILLDEPGLHLHPDAQRDLLKRLEEYAKENTVVYTTHLPFLIDLQKPERIRVLSESAQGTKVSSDLTQTQPEAKFVLQAALGMSGSTSYLLSQRNLVGEGVDDYWIITELSELLERSGMGGLPDDVFITPAGGASEAAYIATFMIGQKLDVVVLLDSDSAGENARDGLVKRWITRYSSSIAQVIRGFVRGGLLPQQSHPGLQERVDGCWPDQT